MNTITAKCPACGAMHTHSPETAEETATCARCGAIYIPSECAVDATAIAHEGANAAKNSEAHLRQIASDLHYIADYIRGIRHAQYAIFLLVAGAVVVGLLAWMF
jgi:endogenous inhibitor of DNA gyrase (YacG/DUF329 family)